MASIYDIYMNLKLISDNPNELNLSKITLRTRESKEEKRASILIPKILIDIIEILIIYINQMGLKYYYKDFIIDKFEKFRIVYNQEKFYYYVARRFINHCRNYYSLIDEG